MKGKRFMGLGMAIIISLSMALAIPLFTGCTGAAPEPTPEPTPEPDQEPADAQDVWKPYTDHYPVDVFVVRNSPDHAPIQERREKGDLTYGKFELSQPATEPWHVGALFPHIKDPWWIAANYG